MSKIKLLDCTLRDGGYINNWDFGESVIPKIIGGLSETGIDIIETGFLTNLDHTRDQSLYVSCAELDKACSENKNSLIAAMIALGEKELDPVLLPDSSETCLDIVRITFHKTVSEIDRAVSYAKCLMGKGYRVCMQPVGTTTYSDYELLELIKKVNDLNAYAFYLVDTLGTLYGKELIRLLYLIDNNLSAEICLGFHSHNNLQMSFANAQEIVNFKSDREFIVDCSVFGMGRGAGNLCTELIIEYINKQCGSLYNIEPILALTDDYIHPIYLSTPWGYSVHYFLAALWLCHPNYASYLLNKQTITMKDISLILSALPADRRHIYDKDLIQKLYSDYQSCHIGGSDDFAVLKKSLHDRNVLVIAPGRTVKTKIGNIRNFISDNNPIIFSINTVFEEIPSDYVFVSNKKRLTNISESSSCRMITTSNLPKTDGAIRVDYELLSKNGSDEQDNSGMMLLRLLKKVGARRVFLAGFDGFSGDPQRNYYSPRMINSVERGAIDAKNASIKLQISELRKEIELVFITPSIYDEGEDHV